MRLPEQWFVLVDAGIHVSTSELFQAPELTRNATPLKMADFALGRVGSNVFAAPARARHPALAALLDALQARAVSGLTGTGGGCFAMLGSQSEAEALAHTLAAWGRCIVARGVNRSPLHEKIDRWRRETIPQPSGA
jgi:4-diphosphocytidyl-2-C-methyl-D-erythritol kinase